MTALFLGCAITGDNQIYLAGGSIRKLNYRGSVTTEGVSNHFYVFDPLEKSWTCKAKMHMSRSQFSLVIVDGYATCSDRFFYWSIFILFAYITFFY